MATVTCVKCGNGFSRTCSCQGNICPSCKARARGARQTANGRFRKTTNGRKVEAARPTLKRGYRVTFRDGRAAQVFDTATEAAEARAAARAENPPVRSFLRTVRVPVEAEAS